MFSRNPKYFILSIIILWVIEPDAFARNAPQSVFFLSISDPTYCVHGTMAGHTNKLSNFSYYVPNIKLYSYIKVYKISAMESHLKSIWCLKNDHSIKIPLAKLIFLQQKMISDSAPLPKFNGYIIFVSGQNSHQRNSPKVQNSPRQNSPRQNIPKDLQIFYLSKFWCCTPF